MYVCVPRNNQLYRHEYLLLYFFDNLQDTDTNCTQLSAVDAVICCVSIRCGVPHPFSFGARMRVGRRGTGTGWVSLSRPTPHLAEERAGIHMQQVNEGNERQTQSSRRALLGGFAATSMLLVSGGHAAEAAEETVDNDSLLDSHVQSLSFGREQFTVIFNATRGPLGIRLQELRYPREASSRGKQKEIVIVSSVDPAGQVHKALLRSCRAFLWRDMALLWRDGALLRKDRVLLRRDTIGLFGGEIWILGSFTERLSSFVERYDRALLRKGSLVGGGGIGVCVDVSSVDFAGQVHTRLFNREILLFCGNVGFCFGEIGLFCRDGALLQRDRALWQKDMLVCGNIGFFCRG